jgi:uncharacterized protein
METLPALVTAHLDEVRVLCEKYSVKRLTLFGSAVQGTFDHARSDLDFAVEFDPDVDPMVIGRGYLDLLHALERLFARRVDLVELSQVRNPYVAASIRRDRVDIYEAA